jgi:hypothetical protein
MKELGLPLVKVYTRDIPPLVRSQRDIRLMKSSTTQSRQWDAAPEYRSAAKPLLPHIAFLVLGALLLAPMPANAAEHALVGIKIFAPVKTVLAHFGNPSQILTGADIGGAPSSDSTAGAPSPGAPTPPMNRPPEFGAGAQQQPASGNSTAGSTTDDTTGEVMYVYQKSGSLTIEFLLSPDGRVIQISLLGYHATSKTSRGIGLGDSYTDVIRAYGYPESQDTENSILTMKYLTKQNVAFNINKNKVVGITVAAVE